MKKSTVPKLIHGFSGPVRGGHMCIVRLHHPQFLIDCGTFVKPEFTVTWLDKMPASKVKQLELVKEATEWAAVQFQKDNEGSLMNQ